MSVGPQKSSCPDGSKRATGFESTNAFTRIDDILKETPKAAVGIDAEILSVKKQDAAAVKLSLELGSEAKKL